MSGGMHPSIVKGTGVFTPGNIFGDVVETATDGANTGGQVRFARQLVKKLIFIGHKLCVFACSAGENLIPLYGGQLPGGAFAIERIEEAPFHLGDVLLGGKRRHCKKE